MSYYTNTSYKMFGPVVFYKKMLLVAVPVMAQLLIQNLVSLIDNFMVAGLGDIKMSSVNIAGQINFVFLVLLNTLCASAGIFMSQYNGAKNVLGMKQTYRYKVLVCVTITILFTLFCFKNPAPVLGLMVRGNSASTEILKHAVQYEKTVAWSWIPMAISACIASSLREIGQVRIPLIISVVATLINTLCNYILIYGNFGFPRLEVTGAAIATVLARIIEMVVFLFYFQHKKPPFYTRICDLFKVTIELFRSILAKSVMILISEMSWVLSETVTTALYNSRGGAEIVSGMSAGFAIANLLFISFNGIGTATGVVMGGTLGAGKLDEARKQKNWILSGAFVFGIFFSLLGCASVLLIPLVFGNLSSTAQVVSRGLLFIMAIYMPAWAYLNAQIAISRTGGDTTMGIIIDLSTNIMLVIPGMFILTYYTLLGPVAMYALIKLTDPIKICIAHFWLKKERWVHNLAQDNDVECVTNK